MLSYTDFVGRLKKSQDSVLFFSEVLKKNGFNTEIPELRITPSWEGRENYSDSGDLTASSPDGNNLVFEIKQSSLNFSSKKDYKYKELIVNSIGGIETKGFIPDYHIILSKDRKYYISIPKKEFDKYCTLKKKYDRIKKEYLWFYFIETDKVFFEKIEKFDTSRGPE